MDFELLKTQDFCFFFIYVFRISSSKKSCCDGFCFVLFIFRVANIRISWFCLQREVFGTLELSVSWQDIFWSKQKSGVKQLLSNLNCLTPQPWFPVVFCLWKYFLKILRGIEKVFQFEKMRYIPTERGIFSF